MLHESFIDELQRLQTELEVNDDVDFEEISKQLHQVFQDFEDFESVMDDEGVEQLEEMFTDMMFVSGAELEEYYS